MDEDEKVDLKVQAAFRRVLLEMFAEALRVRKTEEKAMVFVQAFNRIQRFLCGCRHKGTEAPSVGRSERGAESGGRKYSTGGTVLRTSK